MVLLCYKVSFSYLEISGGRSELISVGCESGILKKVDLERIGYFVFAISCGRASVSNVSLHINVSYWKDALYSTTRYAIEVKSPRTSYVRQPACTSELELMPLGGWSCRRTSQSKAAAKIPNDDDDHMNRLKREFNSMRNARYRVLIAYVNEVSGHPNDVLSIGILMKTRWPRQQLFQCTARIMKHENLTIVGS
jgi:hypothetical protein